MMKNTFALILFVGFLFSCKEETPKPAVVEETLTLKTKLYFGNNEAFLDSTYTLSNNYKVQFTDVKFYITQPSLEGIVQQNDFLFDARTTTQMSLTGKHSSVQDLLFNIGVDVARNQSDPSAFPNTSALNILNASDMHWGWNPGYIFVKLEAKVDTTQDNSTGFNHFLVYHIGKDNNLITKNLGIIPWETISTYVFQANLKLNLKTILENGASPLNLKTEYTSHSNTSQQTTSDKVKQNFLSALSW